MIKEKATLAFTAVSPPVCGSQNGIAVSSNQFFNPTETMGNFRNQYYITKGYIEH